MKKKLVLVMMALMSLFVAVTVTSCNEDDDNNSGSNTSAFDGHHLSGKLPDISSSGYSLMINKDFKEPQSFPIGADGSFDFTLPIPTVADLSSLSDIVASESVSVTPTDVNYCSFGELRIYKDGQKVRDSRCQILTSEYRIRLLYWYVDKDVVVNGTNYNLNLKAGWNIVVQKVDGTSSSYTTDNIPTGLSWT
jgi:hypothetical protein